MHSNIKKIAIIVITTFAGAGSAMAAKPVALEKMPQPRSASADSRSLAQKVGAAETDFKQQNQDKLPNGSYMRKLRQYYKGVPIWGESLVEVADNNGGKKHHGRYIQDIQQDLASVNPALSPAQVLAQAKSLKANGSPTKHEKAELHVMLDEQNVARLVYFVSFLVEGSKISSPRLLIDANSGQVIQEWDLVNHAAAYGPGGNTKTGKYNYGSNGAPALDVAPDCQMRNANVITVDLNGSKNPYASNTPFRFACPTNNYKPANGAYAPLNDAHYFGTQTVNMYTAWLGTKPVKQYTLYMKAHFGDATSLAVYDGYGTAAFSDGNSEFYPLTILDVVAHEISHGFTGENSGLVYSGQSGGINESYSDIAGEAAEYYLYGRNDFLVGAQVAKNRQALRYMSNPTLDGLSIGHTSNYRNGMDVHHSSGVYNKAFYLIATKTGWNTRKAFEIFADANRYYWTPNTNFNSGVCGVTQAAINRGYNRNDVISAFNAVGARCQ